MPTLSLITNTFFTGLINRLGIRPPPEQGFEISNVVQPVSLVDSDITLQAVASTITLTTPFTAGEVLSPAALSILADTGPQPLGNYAVHIEVGIDGVVAGGSAFRIQRRDAANAANIWSQLLGVSGDSTRQFVRDYVIALALNERIRIQNIVTVAGDTLQASIFILPL